MQDGWYTPNIVSDPKGKFYNYPFTRWQALYAYRDKQTNKFVEFQSETEVFNWYKKIVNRVEENGNPKYGTCKNYIVIPESQYYKYAGLFEENIKNIKLRWSPNFEIRGFYEFANDCKCPPSSSSSSEESSSSSYVSSTALQQFPVMSILEILEELENEESSNLNFLLDDSATDINLDNINKLEINSDNIISPLVTYPHPDATFPRDEPGTQNCCYCPPCHILGGQISTSDYPTCNPQWRSEARCSILLDTEKVAQDKNLEGRFSPLIVARTFVGGGDFVVDRASVGDQVIGNRRAPQYTDNWKFNTKYFRENPLGFTKEEWNRTFFLEKKRLEFFNINSTFTNDPVLPRKSSISLEVECSVQARSQISNSTSNNNVSKSTSNYGSISVNAKSVNSITNFSAKIEFGIPKINSSQRQAFSNFFYIKKEKKFIVFLNLTASTIGNSLALFEHYGRFDGNGPPVLFTTSDSGRDSFEYFDGTACGEDVEDKNIWKPERARIPLVINNETLYFEAWKPGITSWRLSADKNRTVDTLCKTVTARENSGGEPICDNYLINLKYDTSLPRIEITTWKKEDFKKVTYPPKVQI